MLFSNRGNQNELIMDVKFFTLQNPQELPFWFETKAINGNPLSLLWEMNSSFVLKPRDIYPLNFNVQKSSFFKEPNSSYPIILLITYVKYDGEQIGVMRSDI